MKTILTYFTYATMKTRFYLLFINLAFLFLFICRYTCPPSLQKCLMFLFRGQLELKFSKRILAERICPIVKIFNIVEMKIEHPKVRVEHRKCELNIKSASWTSEVRVEHQKCELQIKSTSWTSKMLVGFCELLFLIFLTNS